MDLIHGHSSYHPRPVEVFGGKLVLYGCGDCINDYEGITGHERYRGDLRLLYCVAAPGHGHAGNAPDGAHAGPETAAAPRRAGGRAVAGHGDGAGQQPFRFRVGLLPDGLLALRSGAS